MSVIYNDNKIKTEKQSRQLFIENRFNTLLIAIKKRMGKSFSIYKPQGTDDFVQLDIRLRYAFASSADNEQRIGNRFVSLLSDALAAGFLPWAVNCQFFIPSGKGSVTAQKVKRFSSVIGEWLDLYGLPFSAGKSYYIDNLSGHATACLILSAKKMITSDVASENYLPIWAVFPDDSAFFDNPSENYQDQLIRKIRYELIRELVDKKLIVYGRTINSDPILMSAYVYAKLGKGFFINFDEVYLGGKTRKFVSTDDVSRVILIIPASNRDDEVKQVLEKWNYRSKPIGQLEGHGRAHIITGQKEYVITPNDKNDEIINPTLTKNLHHHNRLPQGINPDMIVEPLSYRSAARKVIRSKNVASDTNLFSMFNTLLGNCVVRNSNFADTTLIKVDDDERFMALCNLNGVLSKGVDAYAMGARFACKALRGICCTGAEPLSLSYAITHEFDHSQLIDDFEQGICSVAQSFSIPMAQSDVSSLSRSTKSGIRFVLGAAGFTGSYWIDHSFKREGELIFLIGFTSTRFYDSIYLRAVQGRIIKSQPWVDLPYEKSLADLIIQLINKQYISSAKNIGYGGLFCALLESAIPNQLGVDITTDSEIRTDLFLFDESPGRIVVSVPLIHESDFIDFMRIQTIPFTMLGHITKDEFRIDDMGYGFISDLSKLFYNPVG